MGEIEQNTSLRGAIALTQSIIKFFVLFVFICFADICKASLTKIEDIAYAGESYPCEEIKISESKIVEEMFIEALGGRESYESLANFDLKGRSLFSISVEMMPDDIVKGVDMLGRIFIAYKQKNKKTGEQGVEVFYQRYAGNSYIWINGGRYALKYLFPINCGVVTKESVEQFANMIRHKSFTPIYDFDYDKYKSIFSKKSEELYVSKKVIEKVKKVIERGVCGKMLPDVSFLEGSDSVSFVLEDVAPHLIFKYYLRDTSDGAFIKSWNENVYISRGIFELYELDLLIVPKTRVLKINVSGEDYFVMVKENLSLRSLSGIPGFLDSDELIRQLLVFMFKTSAGCIDSSTLFLLNVDGKAKVSITHFEEFNYTVVNRNIVDQLFAINLFRKNKKLVEEILNKFTYFNKIKLNKKKWFF